MRDWQLLYEEMCEQKQHYQELYTYEKQTTDLLRGRYKRQVIAFWVMAAINFGLVVALLHEMVGNPF